VESSRGTYRGVFSSLVDDPDFQRLTAQARLVLLTLRVSKEHGPGGIFLCYPEVVARQAGIPLAKIEAALEELTTHGWLFREGLLVWVKNALRYDPYIRPNNPKHRKMLATWLASLPRYEIVAKFCAYYHLPLPFRVQDRIRSQEVGGVLGSKAGEGLEAEVLEAGELLGSKATTVRVARATAPLTAATWEAYAGAYKIRYGVEPVRNAKVNGQLAGVVKRLGMAEAPAVAAYYVQHNGYNYVRAGHQVGLLLADAEKLRTEWATGQRITDTQARQHDQRQEHGTIAERLLRRAEQENA
jgi:hypothetical protein